MLALSLPYRGEVYRGVVYLSEQERKLYAVEIKHGRVCLMSQSIVSQTCWSLIGTKVSWGYKLKLKRQLMHSEKARPWYLEGSKMSRDDNTFRGNLIQIVVFCDEGKNV